MHSNNKDGLRSGEIRIVGQIIGNCRFIGSCRLPNISVQSYYYYRILFQFRPEASANRSRSPHVSHAPASGLDIIPFTERISIFDIVSEMSPIPEFRCALVVYDISSVRFERGKSGKFEASSRCRSLHYIHPILEFRFCQTAVADDDRWRSCACAPNHIRFDFSQTRRTRIRNCRTDQSRRLGHAAWAMNVWAMGDWPRAPGPWTQRQERSRNHKTESFDGAIKYHHRKSTW